MEYSDFGPQVVAHEAIGMEWWSWDSNGGDDAKKACSIKVVVYWGQSLESTKIKYPVNKAVLHDYRYIEYDSAVRYLKSAIKELSDAGLSAELMERCLALLLAAKP